MGDSPRIISRMGSRHIEPFLTLKGAALAKRIGSNREESHLPIANRPREFPACNCFQLFTGSSRWFAFRKSVWPLFLTERTPDCRVASHGDPRRIRTETNKRHIRETGTPCPISDPRETHLFLGLADRPQRGQSRGRHLLPARTSARPTPRHRDSATARQREAPASRSCPARTLWSPSRRSRRFFFEPMLGPPAIGANFYRFFFGGRVPLLQ